MTTEATTTNALLGAQRLAAVAETLAAAAISRAAERTEGGARIDDHQVMCERLAMIAFALVHGVVSGANRTVWFKAHLVGKCQYKARDVAGDWNVIANCEWLFSFPYR